jgi:predicted 3-demethylubiquinone-9 3-methyltransferase (glyoxalase superfamily)
MSGCSENVISKKESPKMQEAMQLLKIEDLETILDQEILQQDSHDIWVVFDFNYTLLYPTEAALHKGNIEKYKSTFSTLLKTLSKEECDRLLNNTLKAADQKVVSEKTSAMIQKFRDHGVNFVVCTGSLTKTKGKSSAKIIRKLLQKQKIDLKSQGFPFIHLDFNEFKEYLDCYPSYDNGIITANRSNKGSVLSAFFKRLPKMPKVVIFVDNNPQKIDDALKIANEFKDTKFIICEYKEYKKVSAPNIPEQEFIDFWRSKIAEMKTSK